MQFSNSVYNKIKLYIGDIDSSIISVERRIILQPVIDFIQQKVNSKEEIRLHFICTHNSRRSHFSQIWAQTLAHYFNIPSVTCYSGGTESTALFLKVIETLVDTGFNISQLSNGENPIYSIKYAANQHPIIGFSKKLDDDFNPSSDFVAIMTCDSANEACPFVSGASLRVPLTYKDPKAFDDTPQQSEKYKATSLEIAKEWYYVFSQIIS